MKSVVEALREEDRERLRRMSPAERLAEALALGDAAIGDYAAAHRIDRAEAQRRLERAAQVGRRHSRVMVEILG